MNPRRHAFPLAALASWCLLALALLSSAVRKRQSKNALGNEAPVTKEAWVPPEDVDLALPEKVTSREYFAYVSVADIPYPPYPQNTTDKWYRTNTTPSELTQVMERFRVIMQVVREKEGDREPSYDYWRNYWRKHDQSKGLEYSGSHSWARTFNTFYGPFIIMIEKYQDQYRVASGMHRVWLAKKMGFEKLPVLVAEYSAA